MKTELRNATLWVVLFATLLCAVPVQAIVPVVGIDGVFTIFNDKGEAVGVVTVDGTYKSTYAMDMASGALPCPAGNGEVELSFALSVADPAVDQRSREQWGVEFFRLDQSGRYTPIERSEDGRHRTSFDLYGIRPGLVRIPVYYRFRAGRSYSGFRLLGVKVTTDAKMGAGAGASSICLYVVEPPQDLFDRGQFDRDAVFAWARSLRNIAVGGDERVAVGGIYPLFTPRSVNAPDPEIQAQIQNQIDLIRAEAQKQVEEATRQFGGQVEQLKVQYQQLNDKLVTDLTRAQGDAEAAKAALAEANKALAEMRAQAERWAAERKAPVQTVERPAEPVVVPHPTECRNWEITRKDGRMIIRALVDGVRISVSYANRHGQRYMVTPSTVLTAGQWVPVVVTPSMQVEVSVTADGGRLVQIYGPNGPIESR